MSPKRAALLATANDLFHQQGIRQVSVEEICRQASVSKATFYKYFRNKTEWVLAFLSAYFDALAEAQYAILETPREGFADKFRRMMQLDRQQLHQMGTPLLEELLAPERPEIQKLIDQLMERHRERIEVLLKEGQQQGVINPRFTLDFFFFIQQRLMDSFREPQLQTLIPDVTQRAELLADFATYGMMRPPDCEEQTKTARQ